MTRLVSAAVALLLATPALAQGYGTGSSTAAPSTATPPPSQPYAAPSPPPQGYAPQAQPQQTAPSQQGVPPQQPQRYQEAQPVSPPATGSGSQQVVVNPPAQQPAPPPAPVMVNPPATTSSAVHQSQPVIVERDTGRPTLEIVAIDAAYGALAGAIVGAGIALLDQGNWGRNLTLGTGAGILVGAVVGGVEAYGASHRTAMDGLGSPDRDRLASNAPRRVLSYGGRF